MSGRDIPSESFIIIAWSFLFDFLCLAEGQKSNDCNNGTRPFLRKDEVTFDSSINQSDLRKKEKKWPSKNKEKTTEIKGSSLTWRKN